MMNVSLDAPIIFLRLFKYTSDGYLQHVHFSNKCIQFIENRNI